MSFPCKNIDLKNVNHFNRPCNVEAIVKHLSFDVPSDSKEKELLNWSHLVRQMTPIKKLLFFGFFDKLSFLFICGTKYCVEIDTFTGIFPFN